MPGTVTCLLVPYAFRLSNVRASHARHICNFASHGRPEHRTLLLQHLQRITQHAATATATEPGRHKALASLGVPVEQFQQQGILMALSELSLSYKAPLRAGDTFYVTTAIAQVGLCTAAAKQA